MAEENEKNSIAKIVRPIVLVLVVLAGAYYGYKKYQHAQMYEVTDNAQIETYSAPIVSRVAGYVQKENLEDYGTVKGGQQIVQVDDAELLLGLQEMEADYQQTLANIANAKAGVKNSQVGLGVNDAAVKLLQIRLTKAKNDFMRDQNLFNDKAITARELENSKNAVDILNQQIKQASEDKLVTDSRVGVSESAVSAAASVLGVKKAKIEQQRLKISFTKIYAPISGRIGKKTLEVGQYIQPGQTLATIVSDSTYWIVANFKETQIDRMKVGQEVSITLDSYPDTVIKGKIEAFSDATGAKFALLPPDNSSGNFVKVTQRLPVKISIDDVSKYKNILKAGLSSEVEVKVK